MKRAKRFSWWWWCWRGVVLMVVGMTWFLGAVLEDDPKNLTLGEKVETVFVLFLIVIGFALYLGSIVMFIHAHARRKGLPDKAQKRREPGGRSPLL